MLLDVPFGHFTNVLGFLQQGSVKPASTTTKILLKFQLCHLVKYDSSVALGKSRGLLLLFVE